MRFPYVSFRKLGYVVTPYHTMELGMRSTLDTVDCIPGMGKTADDISRLNTASVMQESTDVTHSVGKGLNEISKEIFSDTDRRGLQGTDDLADELFSEAPLCGIPARSIRVRNTNEVPYRGAENYTDRTMSVPASCAGGIHSVPGSTCTFSQENPVQHQSRADRDGLLPDGDSFCIKEGLNTTCDPAQERQNGIQAQEKGEQSRPTNIRKSYRTTTAANASRGKRSRTRKQQE